jgi:hypothetical protein
MEEIHFSTLLEIGSLKYIFRIWEFGDHVIQISFIVMNFQDIYS